MDQQSSPQPEQLSRPGSAQQPAGVFCVLKSQSHKTSITVLCLLGNYAVRVPPTDKVYQKGQEKPKSQQTNQTNRQWTSSPSHSLNSSADLDQLSSQQENQLPVLPAWLPGQSPCHYTLLDSCRHQLLKWASYPGPAHHKYNYLLLKLLFPTFPLCLVLSLQKTDSAPVQ